MVLYPPESHYQRSRCTDLPVCNEEGVEQEAGVYRNRQGGADSPCEHSGRQEWKHRVAPLALRTYEIGQDRRCCGGPRARHETSPVVHLSHAARGLPSVSKNKEALKVRTARTSCGNFRCGPSALKGTCLVVCMTVLPVTVARRRRAHLQRWQTGAAQSALTCTKL